MSESPQSSSNSGKGPEGRLLSVKPTMQGHQVVKLDNGPARVITIMTRSETLPDLLGTDLAEIRAHLMTRRNGHFRRKG